MTIFRRNTFKKLVSVYMRAKTQQELNYALLDIQQKIYDEYPHHVQGRANLKSYAEKLIEIWGGQIRNLE